MGHTIRSIAIYDTNEQDCEQVQHVLSDYNVSCFNDLTDLWECIKRREFDLVISDFDLRSSTDRNMLTLIKSTFIKLPVIIYTSSFDMDLLKTAMKNGANNYILKTSDSQELLSAISVAEQYETSNLIYRIDDHSSDQEVIAYLQDRAQEMATIAAKEFALAYDDKPVIEMCYTEIVETMTRGLAHVSEIDVELYKTDMPKDEIRNKILLVDDEEFLRELIALSLKKEFAVINREIHFLEAGSAQEAIDIYTQYKDEILCCVIDMRMPIAREDANNHKNKQSAGLEVLKQIKTIDPRCECIILTAYSDSKELCECYRLGAFELCDKDNRDFYIMSILNCYKKAVQNFNHFDEGKYTNMMLYKLVFGKIFVNEALRSLKKHREITDEEINHIVEFDYILNRSF